MFEYVKHLLWTSNVYVLVIQFLVTAFVLWYAKFRYSRRELYRLAAQIPKVPNSLPLIGNAHHLLGGARDYVKYLKWINKVSEEKGGVLGFWFGAEFLVYVTDPQDIETIANASQLKNIASLLRPWLGGGLNTAGVDLFKRKKKVLMPTFHPKVLDGYMDTFNKQSLILVEKLKKAAGENLFDVHQYVNPCTLDIAGETMMGVSLNIQENPNHPYLKASKDELSIIGERLVKLWLQSDFIFNLTSLAKRQCENIAYLKELSLKVVEAKKEALQSNKLQEETIEYDEDDDIGHRQRPRKALLDAILEGNNSDVYVTAQDYSDEVDNFMFGGSDTVSNSICFALMALGANPHVQDELAQELYDIFGDSPRHATKEDLTRMIYTECVMKETLRLFPGVVVTFRHLDKNLKLSTCTLPANTMCHLNLYGTMRRKDIWGKDADEFRPDRFLQGNLTREQSKAFITFGAGPRDCIGKHFGMKATVVILSTLIRNYTVKCDQDVKSIELKSCFVLKTPNGWHISIEPRYLKS